MQCTDTFVHLKKKDTHGHGEEIQAKGRVCECVECVQRQRMSKADCVYWLYSNRTNKNSKMYVLKMCFVYSFEFGMRYVRCC